jgi:ABC-type dipeptide/oligopeptide/nickel transport system permease subunit
MNRLSIIGLVIVVIFVLVAILAPWIAHYDVGTTNLAMRYMPPTAAHWFGTDSTGRDIFSRVVFGARISLEVGVIVVLVSAFVGTFIGAIAGFYSGWVDSLLSGYIFNVFLAFPGLLLAIALVAFLGAGLNKLIFALCIIGWVGYARLIRAQVLKVREYDFVQAARALGAGDFPHSLHPHSAERNSTADRAGQSGDGRRRPCGSIAFISRTGRAAAGAFVGRDDRRSPRPYPPFKLRHTRSSFPVSRSR